MKNSSIEIFLDALFSVTDVGAYERYNSNSHGVMRDILSFKRQVYVSEVVDISQGEDGFTIITVIEDGQKENVRILESIEEIQSIIGRIELMRGDEDINHYLNKKFKDFEKKTL